MAQDWEQLGQRVMDLAGRLVGQVSVCRRHGEAEIIELLDAELRQGLAAQLADGRAELRTVEYERNGRQVSGAPIPPGKALLAWLMPPNGIKTSKALALLGHCDTVTDPAPPARVEAASDAAAAAEWRQGRGWLDMKGGVAAITELFLAHASANAGNEAPVAPLPSHLILLLTTDEEDSSLGAYALLPLLNELLDRRRLKLDCVVNADYCEPVAPDKLNGTVYCGSAGKLLLGISVFGQPAHACSAGAGVNAATLSAHIASGLEDLPSLAVQSGPQRLPPPRVLSFSSRQPVYDVTTPEMATLYVNLLHDARDLPRLWTKCLRSLRELAHSYQVQQRRRMLAWAQRAREQRLPPAPQRALVTDYAALCQAAQASGLQSSLAPDAHFEPREHCLRHVSSIVNSLRLLQTPGTPLAEQICSGRPLVVLSLLPPFYPGGGMPPGDPQRAALGRAAAAHGARLLPLYPNISDLSAFCWTGRNLALAEQGPLFPSAGDLAHWSQLAVPVCNIGPIGYGAHTADERVFVPYLRDTLPRLLDSALQELAQL